MDIAKLPEQFKYSLLMASSKQEPPKIYRIDHYSGQTWLLVANIWVPVVEPKKQKI